MMKSLIAISVTLVMATLSGAVPIAEPQTTEFPTPSNTTTDAPVPTTTTSVPVFSPSSLASYQHPVVLPNGVECIAPYLVMAMSEAKPDQVFPKTAQIGPSVFVALEFNSTHKDKDCRFHFSFSHIADGGNGIGTEDIFQLKSGGIDETLTFNKQPTLEADPVAKFKLSGSMIVDGTPGSHEFYPFVTRADFPCPTANTGWAIRSSNGSSSNWSWNHGLIVEVLGDSPWVNGDVY